MGAAKESVPSEAENPSASRATLLAENRHLRGQLEGLIPLLQQLVKMNGLIIAKLYRKRWWSRVWGWFRKKASNG